jgi:hypothetical protein
VYHVSQARRPDATLAIAPLLAAAFIAVCFRRISRTRLAVLALSISLVLL